jgi:hypothetical protein
MGRPFLAACVLLGSGCPTGTPGSQPDGAWMLPQPDDLSPAEVPRDVIFHVADRRREDGDPPRLWLHSRTSAPDVRLQPIALSYGWALVPERFPEPGAYDLGERDGGQFGAVQVIDAIDDDPPDPVEPIDVLDVYSPGGLPIPDVPPRLDWVEVRWDPDETADLAGWIVEVSADETFADAVWGLSGPAAACAGENWLVGSCVPFEVDGRDEIWLRAWPVDRAGCLGAPTEPIRGEP